MKTQFIRKGLLVLGILLKLCSGMAQSTPTTLLIGFEKDTIKVLEGGNPQIISILLSGGQVPKDSTVEVTWSIKDTDAIAKKDFEILGEEKFIFSKTEANAQKRYFELKALSDNNIENETIMLELSIGKGSSFTKLNKLKLLIIIQDAKTDVEKLKEEFENKMDDIVNKISDVVNKDKDTSEVIGTICLKNSKVPKYEWPPYVKDGKANNVTNKGYKPKPPHKDSSKVTVEIVKVEVLFKYGVATEIRAYTKDSTEIFSNHWYKNDTTDRPRFGVSYRHHAISERNKHYYLIGEKDVKNYIRLNDLIDYNNRTGYNFMPSDTMITLMNKAPNNKANISVNTSLKSYINMNIYTDALGLLKIDQGNGIIQTDVSAKIYLVTLPARDRLRFNFNYLMPYGRLTRFENGFQNVPNTQNMSFGKNSKSDTIDRMLLNQRKYADLGLKLNIVNKIGMFDNSYEFNVLAGFGWFNRQGAVDSLLTKKVGSTQYQGLLTNTFEMGLEARASIVQYRNFGINMGLLATWQRIINAQENKIKEGGFKPFGRAEAEIYFYPIRSSQDKIFFRTYYTFNDNPREENFLRIQVGYKALFKLPNKKKN